MKNLITLVEIVNGSRLKQKKLLDLVVEPNTQMRRLYDAVASGKIVCINTSQGKDVRCASCHVRNECNNNVFAAIPEFNKSESIMATVKSKLRERLEEAILSIDSGSTESSDRQSVYLSCLKKQSITTSLLSRGYKEMAMQKAEQLYRVASEYEFTELAISALQTMRLLVSMIYGDEGSYQKYNALLTRCEILRDREDLAERLYTRLISVFVNQKSGKQDMACLAEEYYEEIALFFDDCPTYRFQLFGRLLRLAIFDNRNDYENVIRLCDESIAFFEAKPYKSSNALQVFYYSLLLSCFYTREFEHGRNTAQQYEQYFKKGDYNWFKWQEVSFLTEMHDGNYDNAFKIWQVTISTAEFSTLPLNVSETWRIFELYLIFLSRCGLLEDSNMNKKQNISKIINDFTVSNRDKSGMNIPILIIQYLYPIAEGNLEQCVDREEGLAKYRTRYLKMDSAPRSHYYFKMLEHLPKAKFNIPEISRRTYPLLEEMKSVSLSENSQNYEVEIIPYEVLWSIVMGLVEQQMK